MTDIGLLRLTDGGGSAVAAGRGVTLSTQAEKQHLCIGPVNTAFHGRKHRAGPAGLFSFIQLLGSPEPLTASLLLCLRAWSPHLPLHICVTLGMAYFFCLSLHSCKMSQISCASQDNRWNMLRAQCLNHKGLETCQIPALDMTRESSISGAVDETRD